MEFTQALAPDIPLALAALGYKTAAQTDAATAADIAGLAEALGAAARPRWCARRFPLEGGPTLGGWRLAGRDIARHLHGCHSAVLLAVTLGQGADALLRQQSAADMRRAVLADALASTLVEQYADAAEAALRGVLQKDEYMTGRYSPGYGDFPLEDGRELVRLADAPRQAGVTTLPGGLLVPGKSITAVLGVSDAPVTGHLAGCEGCALNGKCKKQEEGNPCGKK